MAVHDLTPLQSLVLALVPPGGATVGNATLRREGVAQAAAAGMPATADEVEAARQALIAAGLLQKGRGRGGSVFRADGDGTSFDLQSQVAESAPPTDGKRTLRRQMRKRAAKGADSGQILSYRHADRRRNNPEVGMVNDRSDPPEPKTTWRYDPHLAPELQFDPGRVEIERLIDDALAGDDPAALRAALEELKRRQQPYLEWSGKAERTQFEVDTVSLHVHERIDPASILAAVSARSAGKGKGAVPFLQPDLFAAPFENLPLRDAIDFYRHEKGWSNRLVAGDSLLVMNSLLQKEGMAGQVQTIYLDPPYGIKYGSNFQPFVNRRDVKDRKDEDLTQEPEMIKAFRDTWELGIHSYLTYLRDRLLLARELLADSGSVFVQISDENLHHVRELMDEVFGLSNFCSVIPFSKTSGSTSSLLSATCDFLLWYVKNNSAPKYRSLKASKPPISNPNERYVCVETPDGETIDLSVKQKTGEKPLPDGKILRLRPTDSQDKTDDSSNPVSMWGREFYPPSNRHWSVTSEGTQRAAKSGYIFPVGNTLTWKSYRNDINYVDLTNDWMDIKISGFGATKSYVVETKDEVIERCLLMTTDPGDLVLDPTCGSGTTAYVAEKWGRRWITCDTSRVAVTLARQRLLTASYDYYDLRYPHEGLKSGFIYKTVPHVTLKSIATNPEIDEIHVRMHPAIASALEALNQALLVGGPPSGRSSVEESRRGRRTYKDRDAGASLQEWEVPFDFPDDWPEAARAPFDAFHTARQAMQVKMDASIAAHADQEVLYDQPQVARGKLRISGPFTVEAVPFPTVLALDEAEQPAEADTSVARSGETSRQHRWRDELLKTGIRGKGGQRLAFAELETLPGTRYLHASGSVADSGERVVVSFGPEHAPLEQRQVELALREAGELFPLPQMIVFCAFTFDPEAAKDIDSLKGITALKAQMNTDLLTEDLKKARPGNQSFWLMGQPDVEVRRLATPPKGVIGDDAGPWYQVEVHGFDYFDTARGELISGGKGKIAVWSLDTDYDERSLYPRQVFFPMAGKKEGWMKLRKTVRAELDEALLEQFHGTVSLPFQAGGNRKIAVKIVDDRGIESLKVIPLDDVA